MKSWMFSIFFLSAFARAGSAQQVLYKDTHYSPADTVPKSIDKSLQFFAFGDWGRNGADHQLQVARQMSVQAAKIHPSFFVVTGDNFYPSGVMSEKDPQWFYSLENIYTDFPLQWDWYPVLGNHDYKSNPGAQVAYSKISRRWRMENRYYAKKFFINDDTTQQVLILFIDTNPLIPEFYSNREYGPNVKSQDSSRQIKWIKNQLSHASPNVKWKIVVGHHPMYSAGGRENGYDTKAIRNSLKTLFDQYDVDVYLTGHEHSLQHLAAAGSKTQHFITGAASESTPVHITDQSNMAAADYGFMIFSIKANSLLVQTVTDTGKMIYAVQIDK